MALSKVQREATLGYFESTHKKIFNLEWKMKLGMGSGEIDMRIFNKKWRNKTVEE